MHILYCSNTVISCQTWPVTRNAPLSVITTYLNKFDHPLKEHVMLSLIKIVKEDTKICLNWQLS